MCSQKIESERKAGNIGLSNSIKINWLGFVYEQLLANIVEHPNMQ